MDVNMKHVYEASLGFLYPSSLKDTYSRVVKEAKKLTRATHGSIFLSEGRALQRVYTTVPLQMRGNPRKKGLAEKSMRMARTYVHSEKSLKRYHPEMAASGVRSLVTIPLINRGKAIGIISLQFRRQVDIKGDTLNSLRLLGTLASLAIRKAQLYSDVQSALARRDFFISLASHEFRTPLTTIRLNIELINRAVKKGRMPAEKWLVMLESEAHRLSRMVENLLKLDQIDTGQLKFVFAPMSLMRIIEKTIKNFKLLYPDRKLVVKNLVSDKGMMQGDRDKLMQVFTNILGNAVKYSDPDTPIRYSVAEGDNSFTVSVEDEGKGISRKDVDRVFEKFYKGEKEGPGMGLGLYFAKRIIDNHGGQIRIKSERGEGTLVEVVIPKNE